MRSGLGVEGHGVFFLMEPPASVFLPSGTTSLPSSSSSKSLPNGFKLSLGGLGGGACNETGFCLNSSSTLSSESESDPKGFDDSFFISGSGFLARPHLLHLLLHRPLFFYII